MLLPPPSSKGGRGDLSAGEKAGLSNALIDRLRLDEKRIKPMAKAVDEIQALNDPVVQMVLKGLDATPVEIQKVEIEVGESEDKL